MNPKLIKLASSDIIYANADLIKFVKQCISVPSQSIKPGDAIYFFKDVDFKRGLLDVAQDRFSRVIKLEKATAVVVNSDMTFPEKWVALKNNKIDVNCPNEEADDIVYNISSINQNYVAAMQQWLEYYHLTHKPNIVFVNEMLLHVNSGMVIDENNYQTILDMLNSDPKVAASIIDTCNIEKSLMYVVGLLYFRGSSFNSPNWGLISDCKNVVKYLSTLGVGNSLPEKYIIEFLQTPYFKEKYTYQISKMLEDTVSSKLGAYGKYIDNINIDFKWKQ